nr:MAG TPA: hypothetical protein [Caudoviricetes sp.]
MLFLSLLLRKKRLEKKYLVLPRLMRIRNLH